MWNNYLCIAIVTMFLGSGWTIPHGMLKTIITQDGSISGETTSVGPNDFDKYSNDEIFDNDHRAAEKWIPFETNGARPNEVEDPDSNDFDYPGPLDTTTKI